MSQLVRNLESGTDYPFGNVFDCFVQPRPHPCLSVFIRVTKPDAHQGSGVPS